MRLPGGAGGAGGGAERLHRLTRGQCAAGAEPRGKICRAVRRFRARGQCLTCDWCATRPAIPGYGGYGETVVPADVGDAALPTQ